MQFLFLIIPLTMIVLLGIYFYHYILNIADFFKMDVQKKKNKIILGVSALCAVIVITLVWNTIILVILHVAVIALILEIPNFVCKKYEKKKETDLAKWKSVYKSGLIPLVITLVIFIYGHFNMYNVVKTEYIVHTDKIANDKDYKVAFISDLHYGLTLDKGELVKYCNEIAETKPDVVILGGDIVDESTTNEQMKEVFLVLGTIKSNYGTFFVYGNHDNANYAASPNFTSDELRSEIINNNIKILEDETVTVDDNFTIIGRKDRSYGKDGDRKSGEELLEDVDMKNFLLLVDHQPCEYDENRKCGYDLELSGHTHSGQFFPVKLICEIFNINDMMYGHEYGNIGEFQAIVSSGISGWGYPFRTEGKSEYVIIDITSKTTQ